MKKIAIVLLSTVVCGTLASAKIVQQFEPAKDTSAFKGKPEVSFVTDLTFNYQGLSQDFDLAGTTAERNLQPGLSLPQANFEINAKVMSGFNVKLETMLSSHHHNETYVKGGYATIDNLDFVAPGFASDFMKYTTIKVGVDDINFGDNQFTRSDNADVLRNPFVHNMGVESYMQAPHLEIYYRLPAISSLVMVGITNGQVNPDDVTESHTAGSSNRPAGYAKFAFDQDLSDALRVRASESVYYVSGTNKGSSLYSGDKAGSVSRYIFDTNPSQSNSSDDFGSVWNAMAGFSDLTVSKTHLFTRYVDTELYALLELANGSDTSDRDMKMVHYAFDVVQRFSNDKFWIAGRYENAKVDYAPRNFNGKDAEMTQWQLGLGWYLSKNAVAKIEYIDQKRENNAAYVGGDAEFKGYMISTALSF
ncbi:MAG: hypothetical protein PHN18_08870 [Sulfurospirillaceae bacterium]|nr:hypothetical protein [Sulfurospirillaceae bacterium]MDD2826778.1 hypothetical protein [Sulfurospirillaceae bacterium]